MTELKSEFLCDVYADLDKPIELGITPRGNRQIYYIKGGSVKGPDIKGVILPGEGIGSLYAPMGQPSWM